MDSSRFREYSGDECEGISVAVAESLKVLESIQSILMYEEEVADPPGETVRVGQMRDIRAHSETRSVSFRFRESGRLTRTALLKQAHRLQMTKWESTRTHWAIKDGDVPQELVTQVAPLPLQYDIVLSFAGEDREYVEAVATFLDDRAVSCFYDKNEQATLWGKDLAEHFDLIYRKLGRYCVMFISDHYARKMWTTHERRSALARAMDQASEYVLPARFDDSEIPGLRPTVGYVDIKEMPADDLGRLILQKLGRHL